MGKAKSTMQFYCSELKKYIQWCESKDIPPFPFSAGIMGLYFIHLVDVREIRSISPISSAIAWWAGLCNQDNLFNSGLVLQLKKSFKRIKPLQNRQKYAISKGELDRVVIKLLVSKKLTDLRTAIFMCLAFAGLFRGSELLNLKWDDVKFTDTSLEIVLQTSKTDIGPKKVCLSHDPQSERSCYKLLEKYKESFPVTKDGQYIFCKMQHVYKDSVLVPVPTIRIAYTTMLQMVKEACTKIGIEPEAIGLHSFRRGGATHSASEGVPERVIRKAGRWKSANIAEHYIDDSHNCQMTVSSKLQL